MTFHQATLSAPLMNMWLRKAVILSLFCSVCLVTKSERVYFTSKNFNTTLNWIPAGENITNKYSVQYKIHADGAEYQSKTGCQNITALFCDLTEETSKTPNEHYWGRVLVNGKHHGITKTRFTPLAQTTLGPPSLSTNATASALHVYAILPLGPHGESIGDVIARSNNRSSKTQVLYTLTITNPEGAAQVKKDKAGGQFILDLKPSTTYCGHVFYKLTQRQGRPESEKAYFCEKLKDDPLNYLPWLLFTAVCLLALAVLSLVCTCKYVNVDKKVSLPANLIIFKTPTKVLAPQNETISISVLSVYQKNVRRDSSTNQRKTSMPSAGLGGYSPQDLPSQIWQDSSVDTSALHLTSGSEDTSAQSSVSYSAVAPREPTEEQGPFNDLETINKQGAEREGNHGRTSHVVAPWSVQDCPDSDPSRPLLLHTARDSEGRLVLPSWSSQFQSSTADLQRRPLLSDLINSATEQSPLLHLDDPELSECGGGGATAAPTQTYDSHYTQSHAVIPNLHPGNINSSSTDGTSASCYKQNWVPQVNMETVPMHSDGDRRTDYPRAWNGLKNEDSEAKEETEELQQFQLSEHFLGNWLLRIQN